jgi:hypothetical protein
VRVLEAAGYRVTHSELDPWDSEIAFTGNGHTGEIDIFQECRSRTWMQIAVT